LNETYSQFEAYLPITPVINPPASENFVIPIAQAQALGAGSVLGNSVILDGSIAFSANSNVWSIDGGNNDFIGAAEHEITEVMGRISSLVYRLDNIRSEICRGIRH
jgi:hypothetical protein